MAITGVDTQLTTDSGGLTSRVITKPTAANLAPGDYSFLFFAGNLSPSPAFTQLPPGFTQVGSRVTDGVGPNTHVDVYQRLWSVQADIDGLAAEDWTVATGANTDKLQSLVRSYRGLNGTTPVASFAGWNEPETTSTTPRHYNIGFVDVDRTDCITVTFLTDRITGGVTYTQADSSDTVVVSDLGLATNAVTALLLESPVLNPGRRIIRNLNLSGASPNAAGMMLLLNSANAVSATAVGPWRLKRWTGTVWEPQADTRRWNGSAWESATTKRFL